MSSDNFLLKLNQSELNPIYIIKESTNLIFFVYEKRYNTLQRTDSFKINKVKK